MATNKKPKKEKFPELRVIRSLWHEAMLGDESASAKLLLILGNYKTVDAFVRQFAYMKMNSGSGSTMKVAKPKAPATAWEKGRANFQSGPASVVSGGLPSLGKRSK